MYRLVAQLATSAPQDASVAPSPAHCGSCAAPLARHDASPARHISFVDQFESKYLAVCVCMCWLQCPQLNCSHNPLFEADDLVLLLLPALKVNLNQSLQFHQVLLHPLPVDVLQTKDRQALSLCAWYWIYTLVNSCFVTEGSLKFTYIEIHLLSIGDLRGDEVRHDKGPVVRGPG